MSKAYIKKSHIHKPLKGKGGYDRSREAEHIEQDTLAEHDLAAYQLAQRSLTRQQEQTNGEPEHD